MAEAPDPKKELEASGEAKAYDSIERDFLEVGAGGGARRWAAPEGSLDPTSSRFTWTTTAEGRQSFGMDGC